jgi:hypothetical protein
VRPAPVPHRLPTTPIAAVRASRGTSRLFLVGAASASHAHCLTARLASLERGPWAAELNVYWPN